jgi:hypothetical protein
MTTGALPWEDYSIGVRDGDLVLSQLHVTGWGAAASTVRTKTDRGRLWGRITTGNVFELWQTPTFTDGTKRVAYSGTISAAGPITFAQDNASGFSGTAMVDYTLGEEQLFDVVLTYADHEDLRRQFKGVDSELDSDGKFEGLDDGFESILKQTKRKLDKRLWERYGPDAPDGDAVLTADDYGRPTLAPISDPRQLAEIHALLVVYELLWRRASVDPESTMAASAEAYERKAWREFDVENVAFDLTRDSEIDERKSTTHRLDRA